MRLGHQIRIQVLTGAQHATLCPIFRRNHCVSNSSLSAASQQNMKKAARMVATKTRGRSQRSVRNFVLPGPARMIVWQRARAADCLLRFRFKVQTSPGRRLRCGQTWAGTPKMQKTRHPQNDFCPAIKVTPSYITSNENITAEVG